jgi:pimeloyl-ACP methyl ester carboxylesterase
MLSAEMSPSAATVALSPCKLPDLDQEARCGEIEVPENPDQPSGRRLKIAIAVVPATSGRALSDPIVLLMGGPGEDAISAAAYFARQFVALRARRDLLLVDQRGTGKSSALRCSLYDPLKPAPNLLDLLPEEAVDSCARELSQSADLTQYTYDHFARDLEEVRRALGYAKLNLFAGSYGTRAAQVFVRAYPESVRTAYFWSPVPIDVVTPLTMAKTSESALESSFDACAIDAACHSAFPDIRGEFNRILAQLESGSVRVSAGATTKNALLGRGRVVEWLRAQLYRPQTSASVPWLVHRAYSGDWSPIVEGILAQAKNLDDAYGLGLFFSITCAEDMAFLREGEIAAASDDTALRDYRVRQQQVACRHWPKATLPAEYRTPVRSVVPAMFSSGDLDGGSPLWFMERVASGFSNRVELVARGQGHTEWNDCLGGLFQRFVESGGVQGIDPSSCKGVPRPPFRTD